MNKAGGSNTNYYGKKFEKNTENIQRLLQDNYIKYRFSKKTKDFDYLKKIFHDKSITFILQTKFKKYMYNNYNIKVFRIPDEVYIIEYNTGKKELYILEKKEQCVKGSVETKLWSGPSLKREYELLLNDKFKIIYAFCVNDFLKKKLMSDMLKYKYLNMILKESNINVLFGDDEDYFQTLDKWFNNS